MGLRSLGYVKPVSTTVASPATANLTDPTAAVNVQAAGFQALATNTGTVYICDTANPNLTTGVGTIWEIPAPSAAAATGTRPGFVVGNPAGANPVNAAQIYVLPTVSGEGVRVSILET